MFNLNDLRVEQEIAQERYEAIIHGREITRMLRTNHDRRTSLRVRMRNWLGSQLVTWGCRLKMECQTA